MNRKSKKLCAGLIAILLVVMTISIACAEYIMPYADSEFDSATVNLKSTKKVTYSAGTYEKKGKISITACWLEKRNGSTWSKVCDLSKPSSISNTFAYAREMDYSDNIGTGTFRVVATFDADGHAITRNSNTRTFN